MDVQEHIQPLSYEAEFRVTFLSRPKINRANKVPKAQSE